MKIGGIDMGYNLNHDFVLQKSDIVRSCETLEEDDLRVFVVLLNLYKRGCSRCHSMCCKFLCTHLFVF